MDPNVLHFKIVYLVLYSVNHAIIFKHMMFSEYSDERERQF